MMDRVTVSSICRWSTKGQPTASVDWGFKRLQELESFGEGGRFHDNKATGPPLRPPGYQTGTNYYQ